MAAPATRDFLRLPRTEPLGYPFYALRGHHARLAAEAAAQQARERVAEREARLQLNDR